MFRVVTLGEELPLGMLAPAVELFEVRARDPSVGPMARHVRTPQLLAAMDGGRWGLWLAAPADRPHDPSWHVFEPEVAVLLDPGTWHRGPVPLSADRGVYLTIEAPHTNRDDLEEQDPVRSGTG